MEETEKRINPAYIFDFVKRRRHRILFAAVITFCALCILDLLAVLVLPSERLFSQKIHILLNRRNSESSALVYPSGTPFNQLDIISPAVLKKVYEDQELSSVIPFEKFEKLFSVVNYSRKLAILDADFAQKLAKRNLSIVDMNQLESLYSKQLETLDSSIYQINMEPSIHLTNEKSVKILAAVPQTWMLLFRRTEGSKVPNTNIDTNFENKLRAQLQISRLITIDRATYYSERLLQLCDALRQLEGDRSIHLNSGEYIDDLVESLQSVRRYQIDLLRQMILDSKNLHNDYDHFFVRSQIHFLEQNLASVQMRYDSINKSFSLIQAPGKETAAGKAAESPQQINIDANIFAQIADLATRDSSNVIRKNLAMENIDIGKNIAEIQGRLHYYQQILDELESPKNTPVDIEKFNQELAKMVNNLVAIASKISSFKHLLTEDYLNSLEYYSQESQVSLLNTHLIPPLWLIAISVALWIFFNLFLIAIDFAHEFYTEYDKISQQKA